MKIIKVLNLYAGLGGNRKHWQNVNVTAVEQNKKIADVYRKLYPLDHIIIADAHQYLIEHYKEYDFIWSSPPCQTHSRMMYLAEKTAPRFPELSLYEEIIFLKKFFPGSFVIENVNPYYKPLIKPSTHIGHHLFWSNFDILPFKAPHLTGFLNRDNSSGSEELKKWLGIFYPGNLYINNSHDPCQVLHNCVHPNIGLHVFNESLRTGLFKSLDLTQKKTI